MDDHRPRPRSAQSSACFNVSMSDAQRRLITAVAGTLFPACGVNPAEVARSRVRLAAAVSVNPGGLRR